MALERMSCPVFLKEKEIRKIMCEENCKYRQALLIYYDKKKLSDRRQRYNMNETNEEFNNRNVNYNETNLNKTYRDVLVTEAEIHNEKKEESSDSEIEMENIETVQTGSQKEKKRKKKGSKVERVVGDTEYIAENTERERRQGENREEYEKRRKRFDFVRLLLKIKDVCFSQTSLENKMKLIFKVIIEEIKMLVVGLINDNDMLKNFFSIFHNG